MKILVDILMFILMLLEFSKVYTFPLIHEIIGIALIVLIIIHLLLNRSYFKTLTKGKYTKKRIAMLTINTLFFISFIISLLFGILSSKELLTFLNIGNLTIIKLHKVFAYITLLLLGMHLGINCNSLINKIDKKINKKIIKHLIVIIIIGFSIYSWINLDIFNHLTGNYGFSTKENFLVNILQYILLIIGITLITNIIYKKIK